MVSLKLTLTCLVLIVLPICIFSLLFSLIEKYNSRLIYSMFGYRGVVITGAIGTIIHEFSHMLMCVIFRHNIVDFSLFRPVKGSYDGIMGYVNHSYNKKSIYQNIGNFFIGVAPIVFGIVSLILFMWLLLPTEFSTMIDDFNRNIKYIQSARSIKDSINIYISMVISLFKVLNPLKQSNYISYIIYIFTMYSISTHMDLSKADIEGGKFGCLVFICLIFAIIYILSIFKINIFIYTLKISISIVSFLSIGLSFAIITYGITKVISLTL